MIARQSLYGFTWIYHDGALRLWYNNHRRVLPPQAGGTQKNSYSDGMTARCAIVESGRKEVGATMDMIMLMAVFFAGFYFLILRPEQKRKKAIKELRESLQVGDDITTQSGHVGKIVGVQDEFITFENGEDRVRHKVASWAVVGKGKAADEQAPKQ
jgi:preprotein translocase subunit YajC